MQENIKKIYLAGGCFWGVEHFFSLLNGVVSTKVGYTDGHVIDPTYNEVCKGNTGHTEAVEVVYDNKILPLDILLTMFYEIIDPTSLNKQGNDRGTQYRTGIYYLDDEELEVIEKSISELQKQYKRPIVVEVKKAKNFYYADNYHQEYLDKNPGGYCHIGFDKFEIARNYKPNKNYVLPSDDELKKTLSAIQYQVTRQDKTERAFTGEYYDHFEPGLYVDITTGEPLFSSKDKFDSHCGWPSFSKPVEKKVTKNRLDRTFGMTRVEVRSNAGDSHLGHVFNDGPVELGGQRYCINSASLRFIKKDDLEKEGYAEYIDKV